MKGLPFPSGAGTRGLKTDTLVDEGMDPRRPSGTPRTARGHTKARKEPWRNRAPAAHGNQLTRVPGNPGPPAQMSSSTLLREPRRTSAIGASSRTDGTPRMVETGLMTRTYLKHHPRLSIVRGPGPGMRSGRCRVRISRPRRLFSMNGTVQPFFLGVAQLGGARGSGPRGRRFKSCHPDFFRGRGSAGEHSVRIREVPGSNASRSGSPGEGLAFS